MKTLLFIAAIFLAVVILRHLWRQRGRGTRPSASAPETMVRCDHCGLYLPRREAVEQRGYLYCCEEHRRHAGRR